MNPLLNNATIIDVRTRGEYEQGHYPGAINIPLDQIDRNITVLKKMKTPVVAYCRSGSRSAMAVMVMKNAGLNEVYNGGGLQDMMSVNANA